MPLRLGLWGGTFDPVHVGHLQMATELKQALKLDHLAVIPAKLPAHKTANVTAKHRLNMLKLAVQDYPDLQVDDQELKREGVSYSYLTCAAYRQKYPDAQLFLCMGTDAFAGFTSWYQWQGIIKLVNIAVVSRPGCVIDNQAEYIKTLNLQALSDKPDKINQAYIECCLSAIPVSSSQIRADLAKHQHKTPHMPESVWYYIQQHKLYFK